MSIPDFQSTMLPLLELAADGQEHPVREVVATLAHLMFEHNVSVADAAPPYVLKRVDLDFFEES